MLFLVEVDHVKSGDLPNPEAARKLIEQVILPTVVRKKSIPTKSASILVPSGGLLGLEPWRRKLAFNDAPFMRS